MKIQFDAQQQYQLDAVSAVVDIFDGQPLEEPDFAVVQLREGIGLFEGHVQTEIGVGNRLAITADDLKRNVQTNTASK
jgi:type III restriction enzyme